MSKVTYLKRLSQSRKHRAIVRVIQQSATSCGIACVAMLARLSYRDALRCAKDLWEEGAWDETHYTDSDELRYLLRALGWKLGRRVDTADWTKVPDGSLAAIHERKNKKGESYWHWVVVVHDRKGCPTVLDPRKSVKAARRIDLGKMRLSCYHRINPV